MYKSLWEINNKYSGKRKLKILVVNDDMFQLLIVCSIFEKQYAVDKVEQATNGQEAFDKAK